MEEAKFYQLEGLLNELTTKKQVLQEVIPIPFHNSQLLTLDQSKILNQWYRNEDQHWKLLYKVMIDCL